MMDLQHADQATRACTSKRFDWQYWRQDPIIISTLTGDALAEIVIDVIAAAQNRCIASAEPHA